MTKATLLSTLFTLTFAATALHAAKFETRSPAPTSSITIRVYNYAGAPEKTIQTAASTAAALYKRAGLATRWTRCRTSLDEPIFDPTCAERPGSDVIQLRILPEAPQNLNGVNEHVLGYALPSLTGGFGSVANVFWDRVQDRAIVSRVQTSQLLGNAMAHEVGHLMLGVGSHSKAGLMTGLWDDDHLNRIAEGSVSFLAREAKKIRKDAAARLSTAHRRAAR